MLDLYFRARRTAGLYACRVSAWHFLLLDWRGTKRALQSDVHAKTSIALVFLWWIAIRVARKSARSLRFCLMNWAWRGKRVLCRASCKNVHRLGYSLMNCDSRGTQKRPFPSFLFDELGLAWKKECFAERCACKSVLRLCFSLMNCDSRGTQKRPFPSFFYDELGLASNRRFSHTRHATLPGDLGEIFNFPPHRKNRNFA